MAEQDLIRAAMENIEAFNAGDWGGEKAAMTPDSVYAELATQRRILGARLVCALAQDWKRSFPDAQGTINSTVAGGNTAVLEITWEGTQSGALAGPTGTIPPSGKRVVIPAVIVFTFQGDKINEAHHYFDMMSLLQQIGALPG